MPQEPLYSCLVTLGIVLDPESGAVCFRFIFHSCFDGILVPTPGRHRTGTLDYTVTLGKKGSPERWTFKRVRRNGDLYRIVLRVTKGSGNHFAESVF